MVEDNDRYYNWYQGYTAIKLPKNDNENDYDVNYFMDTCATSGTVSTRGHGEKFNATEFDTNVWFKFNLTQNPSIKDNKSVTFNAKIQRVKSIDLPEIRESLFVDNVQMYGNPIEFNDNPPKVRIIELKRKISLDSLKEMDQKSMPGLKLSWNYHGASKKDGSNCEWADGAKGFTRSK